MRLCKCYVGWDLCFSGQMVTELRRCPGSASLQRPTYLYISIALWKDFFFAITVFCCCSDMTSHFSDLNPLPELTMDDKYASYRPLMAPNSSFDVDHASNRSDYTAEPKTTRRPWLIHSILGALITLIGLVIVLIGAVVLRKPTDAQCTRQLNMYCMHASYFPVPRNVLIRRSPSSRSNRVCRR
jgi:hypothetical protein